MLFDFNLPLAVAETVGQSLKHSFSLIGDTLADTLLNRQGALLLVLFFGIALMNLLSGGRSRLTTARWAGLSEKLSAVRLAKKQMKSSKVNDAVLWCGTPPRWQMQGMMPELITVMTGNPPTVFVPDANQSIEVIGRPKSGKTFSSINPLLASAIAQGMSIVLYDYKADDAGNGGQLSYVATLAARHRYTVSIFSPGRDYSCIINPLDFLSGGDDDTTARMLAEVFHKNLNQGVDKGDAFFGPAGQRLIQALLQFAKVTKYADLGMAFTVLQLSQLPQRLAYAAEQGRLPQFIRVSFSQLIATLESEKTTASIISTASDVLTRFVSPRLLPCLLGQTNVSLMLDRKELLVFHSDIFREDVINPILASIINVVLLRNLSVQRKTQLVFSADELPTIYLPGVEDLANRHRSKGYIGIYGYQSYPQLRNSYGNDGSEILRAGLGTSFWFNPNDYDTAKEFSDILGETEIWLKTKSWSQQQGGRTGQSQSRSEQVHKRPLILPDEFLRFSQGGCVLRNPGYTAQRQQVKEASIPWRIRQIKISSSDQSQERKCEKIWNNTLRQRLIDLEQDRRPTMNLEEQLALRQQEAERLLPLPPESEPSQMIPGGSQLPDF